MVAEGQAEAPPKLIANHLPRILPRLRTLNLNHSQDMIGFRSIPQWELFFFFPGMGVSRCGVFDYKRRGLRCQMFQG